MTEDMEANEKLSPIVTTLFLKQRTLCKKHFTCFMSQPYFKVPQTIRIHVTLFYCGNTKQKSIKSSF